MNTLAVEIEYPSAQNVHVSDDTLTIDLSNGCTISVPLGWFPRLEHVSSVERANWRRFVKATDSIGPIWMMVSWAIVFLLKDYLFKIIKTFLCFFYIIIAQILSFCLVRGIS